MNLSIIIPIYNCAGYLDSGFKSLLEVYNLLNINDFEIIYVNDGSTDDSSTILENIQAKKENIKIINQENQGSSGARNTAIDIAQGKYIQFLDADDYIDFKKVIPLLNIAIKEDLDALSYRLDYINEHNEKLGERPKQNVIHNTIITGEEALIQGFNPSSICVFLFKTSFLNKNNLRITPKITHMDIEFSSRLMMKAKRLIFKEVIAYHYLQRSGSITKPTNIDKIHKLLDDEITVASLVKKNLNETSNPKLKKAISKNYNSIIWGLLWHFYKKKNEVSYEFKIKCLRRLKKLDLYPISGDLKTPFQKITKHIFNIPFILKLLIK